MEKERKREGKGEGREGKGRRDGEKRRRRGIIVGGMVLGLLMGCNNGIAELEKKSSFYESVLKIGQGFQEIFGIFGNSITGDTLGFSAVKSTDNRDKVGKHFKKIGEELKTTNDKLKELSGKISESKNTYGSTIKVVNDAIKGANDVLGELITSVTNLSEVTNASVKIDDAEGSSKAATGADKKSVETIINEVKAIIKTATKAGVTIDKVKDGGSVVENANGPKVLAGTAQASANDAAKLAAEVAKADPWAMIDKIENTNAVDGNVSGDNNNDAGKLATGTGAASVGAKSNADLAAAVALKAMTKGGKFVQPAGSEEEPIKAAAANAINKVLGVLDEIIRRTVSRELYKVGKAVNGMQYSENTAEKKEGATE